MEVFNLPLPSNDGIDQTHQNNLWLYANLQYSFSNLSSHFICSCYFRSPFLTFRLPPTTTLTYLLLFVSELVLTLEAVLSFYRPTAHQESMQESRVTSQP
jgi:hypothetical protein